MSFTQAIGSAFRKYVVFNGRSSRSEYWWWALFAVIGYIAAAVIDTIIGTYPLLYVIWALVVILSGLAVSVRRLHDLDKSGWWVLIGFIPLIGGIIIIFWFVRRGSDGPNQFGEDPLLVSP